MIELFWDAFEDFLKRVEDRFGKGVAWAVAILGIALFFALFVFVIWFYAR